MPRKTFGLRQTPPPPQQAGVSVGAEFVLGNLQKPEIANAMSVIVDVRKAAAEMRSTGQDDHVRTRRFFDAIIAAGKAAGVDVTAQDIEDVIQQKLNQPE